MAPDGEPAPLDTARDAFVEAQRILIEACEALVDVARRSREAAEVGIAHIAGGGAASAIPEVTSIAELRADINRAFAEFDAARMETRSWTMAIAAAEGTSIATIAREFGVSRQYASKLLAEHPHPIEGADQA